MFLEFLATFPRVWIRPSKHGNHKIIVYYIVNNFTQNINFEILLSCTQKQNKILMRGNCLKCGGGGEISDKQTNLLTFFSIWAAGFSMKDFKW
jgi:hypothetical protein